MAQYTKLSEDEIQEIAGRYELQIFSYEPIEQGAGNSNYLLNTNHGKYILTVFEIDPIRAAHMIKILLLLEKHEYPAPRLIKMANGEVLTKYHEKSVLVKPYITGYVAAELDDEKAKQVGLALAKLHEIPAPDYLPDKHSYLENAYPTFMEQEIDRNYRTWVGQRIRYIIEKLPSQLPVGLVHGDIFYDNVLCIEWAAILTSTWRFWKYNIDMPDADKSEKYMQMVYIAKNASAIPKEEFKIAVFS